MLGTRRAVAQSLQFLATTLELGHPLTESLRLTARVVPGKGLQNAWDEIRRGVMNGDTLSARMWFLPRYFPPALVTLVEVGECEGDVPRALRAAAGSAGFDPWHFHPGRPGEDPDAIRGPTVWIVNALLEHTLRKGADEAIWVLPQPMQVAGPWRRVGTLGDEPSTSAAPRLTPVAGLATLADLTRDVVTLPLAPLRNRARYRRLEEDLRDLPPMEALHRLCAEYEDTSGSGHRWEAEITEEQVQALQAQLQATGRPEELVSPHLLCCHSVAGAWQLHLALPARIAPPLFRRMLLMSKLPYWAKGEQAGHFRCQIADAQWDVHLRLQPGERRTSLHLELKQTRPPSLFFSL